MKLNHEAEYICECEMWEEPVLYPVAELIRCRDCTYWNCADPDGHAGVCTYDDHERIRFKWEYCSDGDRKEE